jgi:hypothetical protein
MGGRNNLEQEFDHGLKNSQVYTKLVFNENYLGSGN